MGAAVSRIRREVEGEDGFSRWIEPASDGYKIACCDCGLVHTFQFRVVEDIEPRVQFRASRNARSTGQMRRHMRLRAL